MKEIVVTKLPEQNGESVEEELPEFEGKSYNEQIPKSKRRGITVPYNLDSGCSAADIRKVKNFLQLDHIEGGYDSLQYRIIFSTGRPPMEDVLTIKRDLYSWKINSSTFHRSYSENHDIVTSFIGQNCVIKPRENIYTLIKTIDKLFLNYNFVDTLNYRDGSSIIIEFATISTFWKIKLTRGHPLSVALEKKLVLFLLKNFDFPTSAVFRRLPENSN